jgi:hypothetical protein
MHNPHAKNITHLQHFNLHKFLFCNYQISQAIFLQYSFEGHPLSTTSHCGSTVFIIYIILYNVKLCRFSYINLDLLEIFQGSSLSIANLQMVFFTQLLKIVLLKSTCFFHKAIIFHFTKHFLHFTNFGIRGFRIHHFFSFLW